MTEEDQDRLDGIDHKISELFARLELLEGVNIKTQKILLVNADNLSKIQEDTSLILDLFNNAKVGARFVIGTGNFVIRLIRVISVLVTGAVMYKSFFVDRAFPFFSSVFNDNHGGQ